MNQNQQVLDQRLKEFRKKYYTDKIIRGSLILALLISSILFIVLLSEGVFGFSPGIRTAIVFGLGISFVGVLGWMVLWPSLKLFNLSRTISDLQIAKMVQQHFPDINDKLLNILQLRMQTDKSNTLAYAAIDKKTADIAPVSLSSAINLRLNNKYLYLLFIPIAFYLVTYLADPSLLGASSHR
ncbi:MAG: hypothetical protein KDD45_18315, partial [Bdellovibrionales bacterium]|nr:hypothetical protein [Bdellovibrionales bacterium]